MREPQLIEGDEFKTFATAYSPDGRYLATGGADGVIRVTDLAPDTKDRTPRKLTGHGAAVRVLRFADNDRLLSGAEDNTARMWSVKDAKELKSWAHPAWVQDLAVMPHHGVFFTADADGTIRRFALLISETERNEESALGKFMLERFMRWPATPGRRTTAGLGSRRHRAKVT